MVCHIQTVSCVLYIQYVTHIPYMGLGLDCCQQVSYKLGTVPREMLVVVALQPWHQYFGAGAGGRGSGGGQGLTRDWHCWCICTSPCLTLGHMRALPEQWIRLRTESVTQAAHPLEASCSCNNTNDLHSRCMTCTVTSCFRIQAGLIYNLRG